MVQVKDEFDQIAMKHQDNDTLDQLMVLKQFTRTTGALHEAQVVQMKWWPWLLFTHMKELEVQFSYDRKLVQYVIIAKSKTPKDVKIKGSKLEEWIKSLLGEEYTLRIVENSKIIYES